MIDELCGCGFKDSCYVHCNHDLEACPGKPYKGSDLVATDNQSQDEPLKSATPDIDTQIEEILDKYFAEPYPDYNMGLLPDEQDYDIVKEMRNYEERQARHDAHEAIKTLLIQSKIDELERLKKIDAFNEAYSNDPRPSRLVSIRIDQLKEELT